jgi:hypothetical protein
MIGNIIKVSGMTIEIISDDGERWKCRNLTTRETLFIDKSVIDNAIRLGKAEVVSSQHEP